MWLLQRVKLILIEKMKQLAPSILSADFGNLSQQIRMIEIGGADLVHCDIMDGKFVPNISFGPMVVKAVRELTKLPLDVHLMIDKPENYIEDFRNAGADLLSVHFEGVHHLDRIINRIKEIGAKAGVVLNPATPLNMIENILENIDFVLLMSVNPGFGGQKYINYVTRKISDLASIREKYNYKFLIEVDGGVDENNIKSISIAGCDIFVAGSSIFKKSNITAATVNLKNLIKDS